MQGQRSSVGSLSETINFEHGSSSNNPGNQPVCWNNMWNPAESRIPDYLLPTSDINTGYVSSVSHEQQSLSRWSLGESSSCDMQTEVLSDEQKAELGWSSVSRDADEPVIENRLCEPSNNLSLGHVNLSPLIMQNSNSNALPHSLNLNASFVSHGGESSRVNEGSNVYKPSGSEEGRILCSSASDPLLLPSGNSGIPVVANDGRAGSSLDGRRAPCKRKAIEGSVTQSSLSGSSNYMQHIESGADSPLPVFPGRYNTGSRFTIPAPPAARMNQAPTRGPGDLTSSSFSESIVAEIPDSSQRNHRIRFSSSNAHDSFVPVGTTVIRHPVSSSSQLPARVLPAEYVLDLRQGPVVDNVSAQGQPIMIQMPALPRTIQPHRWSVSSTSRSGGSSSSVGERQAVPREEVRPSNMGRNISEHPMFVPANELRNLVRNPPSRSLASPNLSIPGNIASTSRVGSSAGVRPSSGPWMPPENSPTQFPRRLTEYVRRQLFSPPTTEAGGRASNYSQRSGSTPAQDVVLSSGSGRRGHHLLQPRSALLMERRGDSGIGLPHSLRTLATSGEGSDNIRLSEQIRNVLGLVRRGESLRVEDVMILDQSLFFGMADIYDRHRDMRLDVDNMSYEELLALEERIGNVNTGLNEETIVARLKQKKHANAAEPQVEEEPCCVCQEEYIDGEDIGILECGHDFHAHCIKQWLMQKNICPICKTTGLASRE